LSRGRKGILEMLRQMGDRLGFDEVGVPAGAGVSQNFLTRRNTEGEIASTKVRATLTTDLNGWRGLHGWGKEVSRFIRCFPRSSVFLRVRGPTVKASIGSSGLQIEILESPIAPAAIIVGQSVLLVNCPSAQVGGGRVRCIG